MESVSVDDFRIDHLALGLLGLVGRLLGGRFDVGWGGAGASLLGGLVERLERAFEVGDGGVDGGEIVA